MKVLTMSVFAVALMMGGLVGCGKTMGDLRADGYSVADTGSSIVKKAIDAGIAVYTIVKNVVDDVKDNVITVKDIVVGPAEPTK